MYTKESLEVALIQILGPQTVRGYETTGYGQDRGYIWGRAVHDAGAHAYFTNRPEDEHTKILREAYDDLVSVGRLKFND